MMSVSERGMTEHVKKKIRIEVDPDGEEEIIIRCKQIDEEVIRVQRLLDGTQDSKVNEISLRLGETEYIVPVADVLFFESSDRLCTAYTDTHMFDCDLKLYELEAQLPPYYMRVSKSCILNLRAVESLKKDLTGVCEIGFKNSKKKIYVSRMYYRAFREKLNELRFYSDEKR